MKINEAPVTVTKKFQCSVEALWHALSDDTQMRVGISIIYLSSNLGQVLKANLL